jgi:hypothetical protein
MALGQDANRMKTFRKTVKFLFLLLVMGAATAGAYAFYYWNHSDELLRQTMLERLHEFAPDWDVRVPRARFDYQGRIHLYDLSLKGVGGEPLLDVAEAILVVDREKLMEPHPPMRLARWIRPKLHLTRDPQGVWNFQKLPPPTFPRNVIPEVHLERMTVALVFDDPAAGPAIPTTIENGQVDLIPSGARQWLIKASAKFPHCDAFTAEGNWQIDAGRWDVHGQVSNLAAGPGLSKLAAEFSPEYRAGLAQLEALIGRLRAGAGPTPVDPRAAATVASSTAAVSIGAPVHASGAPDPIDLLGLSAEIDVQYRISQWRPGADREYKLTARILDGELKNPPVAFPLRDVRGEIELDNQQIRFTRLTAQSGPARLEIKPIADRVERRPAEYDLKITGLSLDDRVRSLLKGSIARVYDDLQLSGDADVHLVLKSDGRDHWEHDGEVVVSNCTAAHRKFPYRIEQVEGTITRRGSLVDVAMQGRAGTERISLSGEIRNPGPEADCHLVIKAAGIPIDDQLRSACPRRYQAVIDQLQAHGDLAGEVRLDRPAGLDQELAIAVDGRLSKGSATPRPFPFPLSDLTGAFHCEGNQWTFEQFQGRHGTAQVELSGESGGDSPGQPELQLDFLMTRATFDPQLFTALPEELQAVWSEFNPQGGFEIDGRIFWSPGPGRRIRPGRINARLFDARLKLKSFPFLVTDVAAEIKYEDDVIKINSFSGRHDETTIQVKEGYARYESDGEWRVRLEKMYVDDLEATRSFRQALPDKLWKIVDALDPRGKQSISGMLEFRGKRGDGYPVTAAWDTTTVYTGATINAGVALRDMHGKAIFSGTWDGEEAIGSGHLDLKSVRVFDYQLTDIKGPARMNGSRLVLGSPPAAGRRELDAAESTERLSAQFIGGRLALDADVRLGDPMRYEVWTTLENGDLRRFAQLYMPSYKNLDGKMNGSVDLKGEGTNPKLLTGGGKLVISPAALYDFPVIVKIFNALSFVDPDKKVFDTARFVFDIGGGVAHFERIDLVGDAMTLIGSGTVDFNGAVHLGFKSRLGRKQFAIPIVREFINEVSKGWVGVNVRGTLKEPRTEVRSFQELDNALRRLPMIFDPHGPARR